MAMTGMFRREPIAYKLTAVSILVALLLAAVSSADVQADALTRGANFDIPAQPIRSALIEFSEQADVQVMGSSDSLGNQRSTEVKGKVRAAEALRRLLQDTGLKYEVSRHAVIVTSIVTPDASTPPNGGDLRISSASVSGTEAREPPHRQAERLTPLGEMVVTGSLIPGTEPLGSPLFVMDRDAIDKTGYTTVQDVVRALPQNFGGGPSQDTNLGSEGNTARSTALNLRGLGASATLVLLNGRRIASAGTQGAFTDVSSIPLTAVSRIEVLTDSASAIYGADAVGGVVNFIMRDNYQGAETQASFGSVTEGSRQDADVSQLFGTRWSTGHLTLSYQFSHQDALPAAERELTADSDLRRLGGGNFSSRQSNPGTLTVGNQVFAIPRNQNGAGLTPGSFTPGTFNLQNLNEGRDITGEQRLHSGFLSISQSLGDSLTLSSDALYSRRTVDGLNPGQRMLLDVPAINPFRVVPAGAGAGRYTVAYSFGDDFGNQTFRADVDTVTANVAAKVQLPRHWAITGAVSYSAEDTEQLQGGRINTAALNAALADPNPLTAFNPFGDGSFTNPVTLDRIRRTSFFASDSDLKGANIIANGGLFALPGGQVRLAAGADYREQTFETRGRSPEASTITVGPLYKRHVTAAFAEVLVPLVSRANRLSGIEQLSLSLAGRYDDYSDFGSTVNPRIGAEWSPSNSVSIHGAWGRSFRAPNLADLDERGNANYIGLLPDPQSSNGFSSALIQLGGNSDLTAETARNWGVGIRWAPDVWLSPTLDLSYFNIRFRDRIQPAPSVDSFLTDPVRFAGRVNLNPTAAQRAEVCSRGTFAGNFGSTVGNCLTAPIVAIVDQRYNNTSISTTRGLDLTGALSIDGGDWGAFEFNGNMSYVLDYSEAQTPTVAPISLLDTVSSPLRFKMRDGISWSRAGLGATATVNYFGSYEDPVSVPHRSVGSWTTADLQLSYEVDPMNTNWLAGCSFALSVQNLFDKDPPFVNNPAGVGYDRENFDLLNRFVSLRIRKTW